MSLRVMITGASAGIGEATAYAYARKGARLYLGARRLDKLQQIAKECERLGASEVRVAALDVRNTASVEKFCEDQPSPDILVLNAGLARGTDHLSDGHLQDWEEVLDTNVTGVLRLLRLLLPKMKTVKKGHIVFLSSIAAHQVYEGGAVYCGSKHAIRAIAGALKLEINGTGLRVTTIDPGMVDTEFSVVRFRDDRERAAKVYQGLEPLVAKDIAETILFATSAPAHVNIDQILLTPTAQASIHKVHRKNESLLT